MRRKRCPRLKGARGLRGQLPILRLRTRAAAKAVRAGDQLDPLSTEGCVRLAGPRLGFFEKGRAATASVPCVLRRVKLYTEVCQSRRLDPRLEESTPEVDEKVQKCAAFPGKCPGNCAWSRVRCNRRVEVYACHEESETDRSSVSSGSLAESPKHGFL